MNLKERLETRNEGKLILKKRAYLLRILEAKLGVTGPKSKEPGSPKLMLTAEIVDENDPIGGVKVTGTLSTGEWGLTNQFAPLHSALGLLDMEFDPDSINPEIYIGGLFKAVCVTSVTEMKDEDGNPIPDAADQYFHNIDQILPTPVEQ